MPSLAAVIVETRLSEDELYNVIVRHLRYLPYYTILYIYSTEKNAKIVNRFTSLAYFKPVSIYSQHEYSELLTSADFWREINEDKVLIFQADSGLLKHGIEAFYHYDYIGAPWPAWWPYVGNGGLSLRTRKVMIECIEQYGHAYQGIEDMFFAKCVANMDHALLAPIDIARTFSVEAPFQLGTLGYHAIDRWLSKEEAQQIKAQYEYVELREDREDGKSIIANS